MTSLQSSVRQQRTVHHRDTEVPSKMDVQINTIDQHPIPFDGFSSVSNFAAFVVGFGLPAALLTTDD